MTELSDLVHEGLRRRVVLRPIIPTQQQETDLYRIYGDGIAVWEEAGRALVRAWPNRLTNDAEGDEEEEEEQPWWLTLDWLALLSLLALFNNRARAIVPMPEEPLRPEVEEYVRGLRSFSVPNVPRVVREYYTGLRTFGVPNAQRETYIYQTEKLGRWVTRQGNWHGAKTIAAINSATGAKIEPFIRLSEVRGLLDASVNTNVALINTINSDMAARLEEIIKDGFTNRRNQKWLTDEIAKALDITKKRARRIARDQIHKLNAQLTEFRNRQVGIERYIWRTRLDERVRKLHADREGRTFRWDSPPSDGHPGYPILCRCSALAILDPDE